MQGLVQVTPELAAGYLINRQHEAWRNHINAYCQSSPDGRRDVSRRRPEIPPGHAFESPSRDDVPPGRQPGGDTRRGSDAGALVYKKLKRSRV